MVWWGSPRVGQECWVVMGWAAVVSGVAGEVLGVVRGAGVLLVHGMDTQLCCTSILYQEMGAHVSRWVKCLQPFRREHAFAPPARLPSLFLVHRQGFEGEQTSCQGQPYTSPVPAPCMQLGQWLYVVPAVISGLHFLPCRHPPARLSLSLTPTPHHHTCHAHAL